MSESEAAWMASHLRPVLVPELALFAEWDGRPWVSFCAYQISIRPCAF